MNSNECLYYGLSVVNAILALIGIYRYVRNFIKFEAADDEDAEEKKAHQLEKKVILLAVLVELVVLAAQAYSLANEGIMWPHKGQGFGITILLLFLEKYIELCQKQRGIKSKE